MRGEELANLIREFPQITMSFMVPDTLCGTRCRLPTTSRRG